MFSIRKLTLNHTKSEIKILILRKYTNPIILQINNREIQWNNKDDSVKYLGLHLDAGSNVKIAYKQKTKPRIY